MLRRASLLAVLALTAGLLTACGEEEGAGDEPAVAVPLSGRQETSDGTAAFVLPKGWIKPREELDGKVTFAAIDALDPSRQIFVTTGDSREDAEAEALFVADAYVKQGGTCRRDRHDTTYGEKAWLVDCSWTKPADYRKVMIAMGDDEKGAMLLVGGTAKQREDLADLITPMLASWEWLD